MKPLAVALAAALAACHGECVPGKASAPVEDAAPAERQCLPANICDEWSGCALVAKGQKEWTVIAADKLAPGDFVEVKNVCTSGDTCIAVRGVPRGVVCPPWTVPPLIRPSGYRCAWDGKTCHRE